MNYYPKPETRESLVIFGDGSEAIFGTCSNSTVEGFMMFQIRPTPQMRWKYQIPPSHYHKDDNWIYKVYKRDLCLQLSFDPDFPVWLILCDYNGDEDTPLMDNLIKAKPFINRNRILEVENRRLEVQVKMMQKERLRESQHPDERLTKLLGQVKFINDVAPKQVVYQGGGGSEIPGESI